MPMPNTTVLAIIPAFFFPLLFPFSTATPEYIQVYLEDPEHIP
jgi:hypothetical protein